MSRGVLLMIFVFSTLQAGSQNEIDPDTLPRILHKTSSSKIVNAGDNFQLECESDDTVHWSYPQLSFDMEELMYDYITEVNITHYSPSTGNYRSVIQVINSNYLNTGYYSCIINGTSGLEQEHVSEIYIYVKDPNKLLVGREHDLQIKVATQHEPVVLPCRTTSPDVNVTLHKDGELIPVGYLESRYINVTFDSKIGFILDPIDIIHSGVYECNALKEDVTDTMTCVLDVVKKTISIPKPSINDSSVNRVTAGETLYLECIGMVTHGIKYTIEWIIPNKSNRTNISEPVPHKNCGKNTYACHMSSLTIKEVKLEDAGNYTCVVRDYNGITNSDSQMIKIHAIPEKRGFGIWGKPEKVVAGDTIKLHCAAAKYNYSEDIVWYERRPGYEKYFLMQNKSDVQYITRNDTQYSYKLDLTLINITLGSDADYKCTAKRNDGVTEEREEIIKVLGSKFCTYELFCWLYKIWEELL